MPLSLTAVPDAPLLGAACLAGVGAGLFPDPVAASDRMVRVVRSIDPNPMRHAEYRLLRFLLCHPGQVFSRAQLLAHLWESHDTLDQRTVDVHVLRLRKALGRAKSLIKTVRGAGYMLAPT